MHQNLAFQFLKKLQPTVRNRFYTVAGYVLPIYLQLYLDKMETKNYIYK